MLPWPSVAWTSGKLAPPSMACEPCAVPPPVRGYRLVYASRLRRAFHSGREDSFHVLSRVRFGCIYWKWADFSDAFAANGPPAGEQNASAARSITESSRVRWMIDALARLPSVRSLVIEEEGSGHRKTQKKTPFLTRYNGRLCNARRIVFGGSAGRSYCGPQQRQKWHVLTRASLIWIKTDNKE
jgi:hypothetical protein